MNHLVLHFDAEFIVGTVCADNGALYPITNGREELLWLYFFNNPHQNSISFGKDNKSHFSSLEINYYGRFFEKIEKDQETFTLRGIEHPIIDLLKESGLIESIKNTYHHKTLETNIHTLMTFSTSIGDIAKQKTVEYFKKNGFQIDSYTIPLAELTCYYSLKKKPLKPGNGSTAIFLEATNSSLHLMKLSLIDNYYLLDSKPISWRGKGVDPRKRALARFIVNEVNKVTGVLSGEDEKEDECERLEMYADEWLKRLDAQTRNMPLRISSVSFSKAPNMRKDIIIRKDDLDSDTGQYTQDIKDIFEAFKNDNIRGDVAAVFLLGNCFQSERVKGCFEQIMSKEQLYFYANKDIWDILAMYPKIDINRYASEEARIKERAKAEELKQAEQRAFEDQQRKAAEAEAKRQAEVFKIEQDRKEAQNLFERAIELDKEGKLEDALSNVTAAIQLKSETKEYQRFEKGLRDKLNEIKIRTEQYKSLLIKADRSEHDGDFENALNMYELAKELFDNADIRNKILEIKENIKNCKKKEENIRQLFNTAEQLFNQGKLSEAKDTLDYLLSIDAEQKEVKTKLKTINTQLQEIEKHFITLIREADKNLTEQRFAAATDAYKKALKIKPNDQYCLEQLKKVAEMKASIKPPLPPTKLVEINNLVEPKIAPPPPIQTRLKQGVNSGTAKVITPPPPPIIIPKKNNGYMATPPPPPPSNKK